MTNFDQIVQKRYSVRKYAAKKATREDILACIQAAIYAPTARNNQPWKFIVVDDEQKVAQVANCLEYNKFDDNLPMFVVMEYDIPYEKNIRAGAHSHEFYADIDMGLTIENFCLKAADLGLGTLIMGAFNADKLCQVLNIAEANKPKIVIAIGYAAEDSVPKKIRKTLQEVVVFNGYEN